MGQWLLDLNSWVNSIVWGPYMLILLIGAGMYISVQTKFLQFTRFRLMCGETMAKIFRRRARAPRAT